MVIGGEAGSIMNIIINFYFLLSPYWQTMSGRKPDPSYTRDDLSFVKEPPEKTSIECPICLQIMLKDISLRH